MKAIYFAEVYHLNVYYRPILGDQIKALPFGPVAHRTYNIANGNVSLNDKPFYRKDNLIIAKRDTDFDRVSKSDLKALEYGWTMVEGEEFGDIKDLTHDEVYYKALENDGDYEYYDLLYDSNKSKSEEIFKLSEFLEL
jgi:uncharacterized phage-associated protein